MYTICPPVSGLPSTLCEIQTMFTNRTHSSHCWWPEQPLHCTVAQCKQFRRRDNAMNT